MHLTKEGVTPGWGRTKTLKLGPDGPFCHVHTTKLQAVLQGFTWDYSYCSILLIITANQRG